MNLLSKLQIFILISLFFAFTSCEKEHPVPYSAPNLTLYSIESDPEYISLQAPFNGVAIIDDNDCIGFNCNGIFVYRSQIANETDDFVVYDRTCPYEADECTMNWSANDLYYLVCPCCGSKFNIVGGYLEKGPSEFPPREYDCDFVNGNLYIH